MIYSKRYKSKLIFIPMLYIIITALFFVNTNYGSDSVLLETEHAKHLGPDIFSGEKLSYDMSFWILSGAARGYLQFTRNNNNTYTAMLKAETCGITRLIVGHKEEIMKSVMKYDPEKDRLIPLMFQEIFSRGDKRRKKTVFYDYEKGSYTVSWDITGRKKITRIRKLPKKEFDDLLSFFYNFRMGCYGAVAAEKLFSIHVLVTTKPSWLKISIDKASHKTSDQKKYHATVSMERRISEAGSKMISGWFSEKLVPVHCVIEDAYFFGDINVKLKERTMLQE